MSARARYFVDPAKDEGAGRIDYQHMAWWTQHHGLQGARLHLAATKRVANVCCNMGTWATAFARKHPACRVIGIDAHKPEFSELDPCPHNAHFIQGNLGDGEWAWMADEDPFDFVYGQFVGWTIVHWRPFLQQCHARLAPHGLVEVDDLVHRLFCRDESVDEASSPLMQWWRRVFQQDLVQRGIDLDAAYRHGDDMRAAGLEVVRNDIVRWYVGGDDPGKTERDQAIGRLALGMLMQLVPGVTEQAIGSGSLANGPEGRRLTDDEARALARAAVQDLEDHGEARGFYVEVSIAIGRNPRA